MSWLKTLALSLGIAAIPVIGLARTAAVIVWSAPLTAGRAAVMLLLIGGAWFALAILAGRAFPRHRTAAVSAVGWFALAFLHVGQLREPLQGAGWVERWHWLIVLIAAGGIAVWIATRFENQTRYLTTFIPILVALQLVLLVVDLVKLDEPAPVAAAPAEATVGTPPSIWVIMLDAHASPKVLRDLHDVDISASTARLEAAGFRVWDDARSNYSHTLVSIPSLLSGAVWDPPTVEASYGEMLAGLHGDTPVVRSLRDAGLTVRMIPANWSRSHCGSAIDVCFGDPRYDEHWHFLIQSTPLPDLFSGALAHPWPTDGLETLKSITRFSHPGPHFTFVHSLASHPPAVIGPDCSGVSERDGRLADQLRCTHDAVFAALDSIDLTTDVVIITADHGYAVGDLSLAPALWSDAMARDRFSAFTAISTPDDCESGIPENLSTAQILPAVLNCYGGDVPVPEHRFLKVNHISHGGVGATQLDWDGWSVYAP